ncbi:MAG: response regulator [Alphaproteobacteria bacterium]|nr:response regulator [Alphaproteobacteria bacterium]
MGNEPVNILLVDDQPAKLLSYETILHDLSENLLKATSATEALQYLLKQDVAVILIDVCMPDLDGFELAAMIRGHPRFQATAIIFISAIAMTDLDRIKGYEYGAVDYVPVPVVPELLRAKVSVFVDLYRKTRQLEVLNAELERRVAARTAELELTNAELERRVEQRTREREMAIAQVHEMQKLESLGQLTGGLAHDFNNLLMAILGNLDVLAKTLPADTDLSRFVDGALQAAERGANLTRRMLAFARRQELRPEALDVPHVVDSMADMLKRSLGPTIEIRMDFAEFLPSIRVDPNQFELALLNLSLNARDAMPQGGQLTIAARRETVRAGDVQNLGSGEYVRVAVKDTGVGMDEATQARAPEPFFTTKEVGKGTGLGLSTVYGLAAQSGGVARIASQLGRGTTVELWLPVATGIAAAETAPTRPGTAATERLRPIAPRVCHILVVDDDSLVAESTVSMLEHLGHRAIVTSSGAVALEALRTEPQIDLVITDQVMPGMTGIELARRMRLIRPELPIILATGYSDLAQRRTEPGIATLDKPYHLEKLAAMIARAMARDGAALRA